MFLQDCKKIYEATIVDIATSIELIRLHVEKYKEARHEFLKVCYVQYFLSIILAEFF